MKRTSKATISAFVTMLSIAAPGAASATAWAYADCSLQSNACYGDGGSDTGPFTLIWSFDYIGIDAIFPQDCTNQTSCRFWCPRHPGNLTARLYVYDANWNVLAVSEPALGVCAEQDIILP